MLILLCRFVVYDVFVCQSAFGKLAIWCCEGGGLLSKHCVFKSVRNPILYIEIKIWYHL
jgi:hypothetical protein